MFPANLFREVANHRRLFEKQSSLFQLFVAAFEVADPANEKSVVQKEFLITEIGFSYQQFGYSLFSLPSLALLKDGICKLIGIDYLFVHKYMTHLKNFLREEIQFEKQANYFSEENIELCFAKEFIKRIYCTKKNEDIYTGMVIFKEDYIDKLRNLAQTSLANTKNNEEDKKHNLSSADLREYFIFDSIFENFFAFLNEFSKDPLLLIVSRLESFLVSLETTSNSIFIFKEQNIDASNKSKRLASILALLIPHKNNEGHLLTTDNMLSLNQIAKLLSHKYNSNFFNLSPLRAWFYENKEENLKESLVALLEEALKCGVVFKVPQGNKSYSYGLTENGLKVIRPYQAIISEALSS